MKPEELVAISEAASVAYWKQFEGIADAPCSAEEAEKVCLLAVAAAVRAEALEEAEEECRGRADCFTGYSNGSAETMLRNHLLLAADAITALQAKP